MLFDIILFNLSSCICKYCCSWRARSKLKVGEQQEQLLQLEGSSFFTDLLLFYFINFPATAATTTAAGGVTIAAAGGWRGAAATPATGEK